MQYFNVYDTWCRFLHDPKATEGFVGSALFANMFRFYKKDDGEWDAEKVIDVPSKEVIQDILDHRIE